MCCHLCYTYYKAAADCASTFLLQRMQDLNPVMSLVHRRCGDTKAAVRRGALQLLEALLVMRASWQVYPRQLPSSADLALLEAATTDPLVRPAAAAACRSVRCVPSCCTVPCHTHSPCGTVTALFLSGRY
jgi:hypothetical protein